MQQNCTYTRFQSTACGAAAPGGTRPRADCLLHLLTVDSAQGSNALGFFLAAPCAARAERRAAMMRRPPSSAARSPTHGMTPSARKPAPQTPLTLAGYLQKILTARVYDVAIETRARRRARRSRRGSATTCS